MLQVIDQPSAKRMFDFVHTFVRGFFTAFEVKYTICPISKNKIRKFRNSTFQTFEDRNFYTQRDENYYIPHTVNMLI